MTSDTRAQAHTLEAVMAALVVVASLVFALQVTVVTPLTASTSSQHIENQHRAMAEGLLSTAAADGALRRAVLYWDNGSARFRGVTSRGVYTMGGPPNELGRALNNTFRDVGVAFNVNVYYRTVTGSRGYRRMVYMGAPSDHAVVVTRTVTVYDEDRLTAPNGTSTGPTLAGSTYFANDIAPRDHVYNVLVVEVVAWRM